MALHVLEREQLLPIPIDEAWPFFTSPRNLIHITPPSMGLVIHEPLDDTLTFPGQRFTYTVRPLLGGSAFLGTLIERVEAPILFVDTQVKGPFKRWWHQHRFEAADGGTRMLDRLEYELPLGSLGDLAHVLLVKRRIRAIFNQRYRVLEDLFTDLHRTT
ncbi:MAG: SRPBCC family protein [Flavobacteriales bacterium]